jgi:hypothetical protein
MILIEKCSLRLLIPALNQLLPTFADIIEYAVNSASYLHKNIMDELECASIFGETREI